MKRLSDFTDKLERVRENLKVNFGVKQIGLFGSYTKGEQSKESDLDVLVELEDKYQTFHNYMQLKFYLETLLNSQVDLVLKDSLKERLKEKILRDVISV